MQNITAEHEINTVYRQSSAASSAPHGKAAFAALLAGMQEDGSSAHMDFVQLISSDSARKMEQRAHDVDKTEPESRPHREEPEDDKDYQRRTAADDLQRLDQLAVLSAGDDQAAQSAVQKHLESSQNVQSAPQDEAAGQGASSLRELAAQQAADEAAAELQILKSGQHDPDLKDFAAQAQQALNTKAGGKEANADAAQISAQSRAALQLNLDALAEEAGVEQVSLTEIKAQAVQAQSNLNKLNAVSALQEQSAAQSLKSQHLTQAQISQQQFTQSAATAADALQEDLTAQLNLKDTLLQESMLKNSDRPRGSEMLQQTQQAQQALNTKAANADAGAASAEALQILKQGAAGTLGSLEQARQQQLRTLEGQLRLRSHQEGALSMIAGFKQGSLPSLDPLSGMQTGGTGAEASSLWTGLTAGAAGSAGADGSGSFGAQGQAADLNSAAAAAFKAKGAGAQSSSYLHLSADAETNAERIAQKVQEMAARNLKQLTIDLNPANLGRMQISIALNPNNEALAVSIGTASRNTKDLLAKSLDSLKQILNGKARVPAGRADGSSLEVALTDLPEAEADQADPFTTAEQSRLGA